MANKTINQLTAGTALTGVEELAAWQSGNTVKIDVDDISAYTQGRLTWTEAPVGRALARTDIASGVKSTSGALPNFSLAAGVFQAGDVVYILNASSNPLTITPGGGFTFFKSGSSLPGTRTLANRAVAVIHFTDASEAYIDGTGVS